MKKLLSIVVSVVIMLCSVAPFAAFATDMHSPDLVLTKRQLETDAYKYIEKSLAYAAENARDDKMITITLPSGTYYLDNGLHIYSNTRLVLQSDTVLIKNFTEGNMLKCGKKEEKNSGYNGYKNIEITGGIWNENFCGTSCGMRFAHCSNVTLKNVTIQNNFNSHHIEIGAAENFSIIGCSFSGYKKNNTADGTALQIDVMHNSYHFPSYAYYDDTPCKNITVSGCVFDNVYAGIGTYCAVVGSYFDNMLIENNTFSNIKDKAVSAFNYVNSKIINNTVSGATVGITFEYYPSIKFSNRFYMPNSSSASTDINTDCNCEISGNTVETLKRTSKTSAGIAVYGGVVTKNNRIKKGKYTVQNLVITNNKITSGSPDSCGMYLRYMNNSTVTKNKITQLTKAGNGYNGITLSHSSSNDFKSNKIKKFDNSIAFRDKSTGNALYKNTFENARQYGVAIGGNSNVTVYNTNTFKNNKKGMAYIKDKVFKGFKPIEELKKEDGKLSWKKVKKVSGYLVYRSTKKAKGYKQIKKISGRKHNEFTDENVKKGKKYFYKIACYKSYNSTVIYGPQSDFISVKY